MSEALSLQRHTNGQYCLSGELDRDTVPPFWHRRSEWLPKEQQVFLDLSGVKRVDSAGMAMLLHLQHELTGNQQSLTLTQMPTQLRVLLQLSNVEELFSSDRSLDSGE